MSRPVPADEVKPEKVVWLWRNRIPVGMISTIAGKPDQGKGLTVARIAADVSRNAENLPHLGVGVKVLYSALEDPRGLITRPRLEAAGANLENVLLWEFQLPAMTEAFEAYVVKHNIKLVVMDPFNAHLSHGVNRGSDSVRKILNPLKELCERTGCSVVVIDHVIKNVRKGSHLLSAIGGSGSGLPAASRTAFVFGVDPDADDARMLCPAKFNIGPKPMTIRFEVDTEDLEGVGETPMLVYDDEVEFDGMRLFEKKDSEGPGRPADKRAAACEWLADFLVTQGGPTPASEVKKAAENLQPQPIANKTLRRAREEMGIIIDPPGGGRNCTWWLPEEYLETIGLDKDGNPLEDDEPEVEVEVEVDPDAEPTPADAIGEIDDDQLQQWLAGSADEEGGDAAAA